MWIGSTWVQDGYFRKEKDVTTKKLVEHQGWGKDSATVEVPDEGAPFVATPPPATGELEAEATAPLEKAEWRPSHVRNTNPLHDKDRADLSKPWIKYQ